MPVVFVTTILFVLAGTSIHRHTGVSLAAVSACQLLVGAGLYLLSVRLDRRFIRLRAEALRKSGPPAAGFSTPAVPRWVVEISNAGFGALLAGVLPLAESVAP